MLSGIDFPTGFSRAVELVEHGLGLAGAEAEACRAADGALRPHWIETHVA